MLYFDQTATTKPNQEVLDVYMQTSNKCWYNASSNYVLGTKSKQLFDKASILALNSLGVTNKKVVFTSGATEANNLAIYGICNKYLGTKKRIITTKIEHPSVMSCFEDLASKGFEVIYLNVDHNGLIDLNELNNAINSDTVLVSIMWVNNIIGVIEPIKEIIQIVKKYPRTKLHIDAVQGFSKLKNDFSFDDVDLITISAHKIHGLKGTGALFINKNLDLVAPLKGATQQEGLKPGTIDVAGAVSCAKAMQLATIDINKKYQYVLMLHTYLKNKLSINPNIVINTPENNYSPYIFNFSMPKVKSETIIHTFEQFEIYASSGSACSAKLAKPEKTIYAISNDANRALSAIRISLCEEHTTSDIDKLVEAIDKITILTKEK